MVVVASRGLVSETPASLLLLFILDLVAVLVPPFCSLMGTNWLIAVVEPAAAAEDVVGSLTLEELLVIVFPLLVSLLLLVTSWTKVSFFDFSAPFDEVDAREEECLRLD